MNNKKINEIMDILFDLKVNLNDINKIYKIEKALILLEEIKIKKQKLK